jgi:tRNA threonylcarbamoyladenosine biosynthesis protein TsaB
LTLVAFDTSTPDTVAAVEAGGMVSTLRLEAPPAGHPAHSTQLLGALGSLLGEAGSSWESVIRIGVGIGPGTFTGLRIAAATAEGLRRANGAEVVPVGSLEALSLPARRLSPARPVCALIDARRNELFAAGWRPGGEPAFAPRVVGVKGVEALFGADPREWVAVGEVPDVFEDALLAAGVQRPGAEEALNLIDGPTLCELAAGGEPLVGPVLPEYLREPDARSRVS